MIVISSIISLVALISCLEPKIVCSILTRLSLQQRCTSSGAAPESHGRRGRGGQGGQGQGSCSNIFAACGIIFAQVIAAEGEKKASGALREASEIISESPAALQLRYLQVLGSFYTVFRQICNI